MPYSSEQLHAFCAEFDTETTACDSATCSTVHTKNAIWSC